MNRTRIAGALAGVALTAGAVAVPVAGGSPSAHSAAKTTKVTIAVGDYFYKGKGKYKKAARGPVQLTWAWPESGDTHDVVLFKAKLRKGKLSSKEKAKLASEQIGGGNVKFRMKLTKPGVYQFYCTLHSEMTYKYTVK